MSEAPSDISIQPRSVLDPGLEEEKQAEGDRERQEQVAVGRHDGVIDREPEEQRAEEREHLDHEREKEQVRERAAQAGDPADQRRSRTRGPDPAGLEAAHERQLQRDPGEVPRDVGGTAGAGRRPDRGS